MVHHEGDGYGYGYHMMHMIIVAMYMMTEMLVNMSLTPIAGMNSAITKIVVTRSIRI